MGSRKKAQAPQPKVGRVTNEINLEIFAHEYLIDFNATRAAIAAGYAESGAAVHGSKLLRNDKVQDLMQKAMTRRLDRLEVTGQRVIEEIAKLAFANIGDYVEWDGNGWRWKNSKTLTREQTAAIQEVAETVSKDGGSTKLKMYDKRASLELLGRWHALGLWKDSVEVTKPKGEKSEEFTNLMAEVRKLYGSVRSERGK